LRDPDENGVKLYCDRPKELWRRTGDGKLPMYTRPLDLHKLLSELKEDLSVSSGPTDL
jgi:catechol 2,3-dioxygenase